MVVAAATPMDLAALMGGQEEHIIKVVSSLMCVPTVDSQYRLTMTTVGTVDPR